MFLFSGVTMVPLHLQVHQGRAMPLDINKCHLLEMVTQAQEEEYPVQVVQVVQAQGVLQINIQGNPDHLQGDIQVLNNILNIPNNIHNNECPLLIRGLHLHSKLSIQGSMMDLLLPNNAEVKV